MHPSEVLEQETHVQQSWVGQNHVFHKAMEVKTCSTIVQETHVSQSCDCQNACFTMSWVLKTYSQSHLVL